MKNLKNTHTLKLHKKEIYWVQLQLVLHVIIRWWTQVDPINYVNLIYSIYNMKLKINNSLQIIVYKNVWLKTIQHPFIKDRNKQLDIQYKKYHRTNLYIKIPSYSRDTSTFHFLKIKKLEHFLPKKKKNHMYFTVCFILDKIVVPMSI